jgi:hypothetical protein
MAGKLKGPSTKKEAVKQTVEKIVDKKNGITPAAGEKILKISGNKKGQ